MSACLVPSCIFVLYSCLFHLVPSLVHVASHPLFPISYKIADGP